MLRDSSERESSRSCRSSSDDASEEVVEAAGGALAVAVVDERVHLLAQVRDVRPERQHVLDRAVVEVEADAHEPLLAGRDERVHALGRPLEQELALDDRRQRRRCHTEVTVRPRDGLRARARPRPRTGSRTGTRAPSGATSSRAE